MSGSHLKQKGRPVADTTRIELDPIESIPALQQAYRNIPPGAQLHVSAAIMMFTKGIECIKDPNNLISRLSLGFIKELVQVQCGPELSEAVNEYSEGLEQTDAETAQNSIDADRYRFLRNQDDPGNPAVPCIALPTASNGTRGKYLSEGDADRAIDLAIQHGSVSGRLE